ncbi:MAG: 3-phosphoshikimate 1-carboxyvinyltransferase [Myxococcales bacterium]|nr:3-phosphoshikimate 1-carboxyvinyltransferase [Myxococcales bacterium]
MSKASKERLLLLAPTKPVEGAWRLRGSKSYAGRALLMAALAEGESFLRNLSDGDDTVALLRALRQIGIPWRHIEDGVCVTGCAGKLPAYSGVIDVGAAGTTMRFLIALCALLPAGRVELRGTKRMHQRPVGGLVDALRALGAKIEYLGDEGCPPVLIEGGGLQGPGPVSLPGHISSQFLTALLQIAPLIPGGLQIEIEGDLVSQSYVAMTLENLRHFGVRASHEAMQRFTVEQQPVRACALTIEGDASGASYLWGLAAISQGKVRVSPLSLGSLQGDARFPLLLEQMGCLVRAGEDTQGPWIEVEGTEILQGVEVDMEQMPDTAQTLAVIAAFASGETKMTGLQTLRYKETDRLTAICQELEKMGISAHATDDTLVVSPPSSAHDAEGLPKAASIATYEDHRMAMAFAIAAARISGMIIEEPHVVSKSFPDFWACMEQLGLHSLWGVPSRIALIGFMGSGKSTVSRWLAKRLGYRWIESDQEVLCLSGRASIAEIFSVDGEPTFRLLERDFLASLVKEERVIISTGGGAAMEPDNIRSLRQGGGLVCYLKTSFASIEQRLVDIADRPLFQDKNNAVALYLKRLPVYESSADLVVETDEKSPEQIVETILSAFSEMWREDD